MQTQSDPRTGSEPLPAIPARRSIFPNYRSGGENPAINSDSHFVHHPKPHGNVETLQGQIDAAVARGFIYRFLAVAYEYPAAETWEWMTCAETQLALQSAIDALDKPGGSLCKKSGALFELLRADRLDTMIDQYLHAFGHAARGPCPLNEIEYGDLKADALFQPHRLADLAAFYRAFGLEVGQDAGERQDHLSIEFEFMSVLAAKEAYALEQQLDEELGLCRIAQLRFLREHLGRWLPAFIWRLSKSVVDGPLLAIADFSRAFVNHDCARFAITPGSEDLVLRPLDEAAESLCTSCGIQNLPPGAFNVRENAL